ncbi:J domain-containing protein [uncultured Methanobrevibacter sp.]|uniref:J domain-containing protein n=1 Tax=uncultured Methanobrevibacter sp. TaxID=253161 RepID=UPI0025DAD44A|nr:J domain-containing protein [uncultured Methanobrevibacter sp.]
MNVIQAFKILELHPNASQTEVKKAFKQLSKKYPPDVSNYDSTAKFQEINNAYEIAYKYAGKNKNMNKTQSSDKPKPAQPVKRKNTATRKTKSPTKKPDTSSISVGWIFVGVFALIILLMIVPGLQLIAFF